MKNTKYNVGFSLIEITIAIVIIALISAAIVSGKDLVKQARMRSVISDVNKFSAASTSFKSYYGALPGDFGNAFSYWGADNGNNNGKIEDYYPSSTNSGTSFEYRGENMYFWEHLGNNGSKLLPNAYRGYDLYDSGFGGGSAKIDLPKSSYSQYWGVAYDFNRRKNYFITGAIPPNYSIDFSTSNIFTPFEAKLIDKKIDDGLPYNGAVMASQTGENMPIADPSYSNVSTNNVCTTGSTASISNAATYNVANQNVSCTLIIEIP